MKVKRYIGDNVQDAYQKVREELGRDAVIINTRKIRKKGLKGLFSKPLIEVVAAVDDNNGNIPSSKSILDNKSNFQMLIKNEKEVSKKEPSNEVFINKLNEVKNKSEQKPIENEFNEIKTMLNKVYKVIKANEKNLSEICQEYINRLRSKEVDEEIIESIIDKFEKLTLDVQNNEDYIRDFLYNLLSDYISVDIQNEDDMHKKILVFIGPTGVGKTTTMAKLAALYSLDMHKKVAFITSDTYRIAAVEQLKTYSDIMGIPLSVIYSPQEFKEAVDNFKEKDIIMVDTAGRSHKDKYQLAELKHLLDVDMEIEVYLVMSAGTKMNDCREILKSYDFVEDYRLLFTKLDETSTHGILLNTSYIAKKPLSYITYGQSVPDDIEIANKRQIINSLLGDKIYEGSSS
ncbi:flagellar biosynthesis protein FlhF [Lutispora thermophila]|uniref:Flagellar biosynthesis protein FlhF n=1 Tax=Lutispora thermophila DSM 19022 TaxID=1122184 RepID=A0A1M6G7U1_9FIRM|nr:flagellar biosynthesis protein FlhF [Lutispora thermophila]SHJ06055.1 flagellar biosynthesis protein FlhF [Lutispora thermophila DSM 19022]